MIVFWICFFIVIIYSIAYLINRSSSKRTRATTHVNSAPDDSYQPIKDYVVIDLETTGLHADSDKIIELAAIKVVNGVPVKSINTFVQYKGKLSSKITSITGIRDVDLINAPDRKSVLRSLKVFVGDLPLIGHNIAEFDNKFLWFSMKSVGIEPLNNPLIDTLELAKQNFILDSYRLSSLCEKFDIKIDNTHRALDDAKLTLKLFIKMQEAGITVISSRREYDDTRIYPQNQLAHKDIERTAGSLDHKNISGKRFAITSFNEFYIFKTVFELQQFIVDNGGIVGGVTQKTDYLIDCDPSYTSTKERKVIENIAKGKSSTKILSPDEFIKMIS